MRLLSLLFLLAIQVQKGERKKHKTNQSQKPEWHFWESGAVKIDGKRNNKLLFLIPSSSHALLRERFKKKKRKKEKKRRGGGEEKANRDISLMALLFLSQKQTEVSKFFPNVLAEIIVAFLWPPTPMDSNIHFLEEGRRIINLHATYKIVTMRENNTEISSTPQLKEEIQYRLWSKINYKFGELGNSEGLDFIKYQGYADDPLEDTLYDIGYSDQKCLECKKELVAQGMTYCRYCACWMGEMWKFCIPPEKVQEVILARTKLLNLTVPIHVEVSWLGSKELGERKTFSCFLRLHDCYFTCDDTIHHSTTRLRI